MFSLLTFFKHPPIFYSKFLSITQPSQSSDEYDYFIKTFEQLIVHLSSFKPHFLLLTDDFNARSSSWWSDDVDNIVQGLNQLPPFTDYIK